MENSTTENILVVQNLSKNFKDRAQARHWFKEDVLVEKPTLEDIMLYTVKGEQYV